MNLYSIHDKEAKTFNTPIGAKHHPQAVRLFRTEINRADPGNMLYLYPDQFDLYCLGHFDEETGEIKYNPLKLINGNELKIKE